MQAALSRVVPEVPVSEACRVLQDGGLVALPTETVYGLGADATRDDAVAKIFEAKGRPTFNPLIVHVPDLAAAEQLAEFSDTARALAEAFWPGALTLVLPRRKDCPVSLLCSAGLDSLAIRVPSHPAAQALLREAGLPIAAPSANRSGHVSPTRPRHVREDLGDDLPILAGDPPQIGLESTILGLADGSVRLLRPGGVALEEIEAICGRAERQDIVNNSAPSAPGQFSSHYAPTKPLRLNAVKALPDEALLGYGKPGLFCLSEGSDPTEAAANLFRNLRLADASPQFTSIAVSPIPMEGLGLAINDRLRRAAAPRDT